MTGTGWWSPQLNAVLAGLVVAAGGWLAWDSLSPIEALLIGGGVAGLLFKYGRTISHVWAWATLILGLESFTWPILTMVQIRSATTQPTDEQMGTILSAVVAGLLSAVFWISFSYGLFKRAKGQATDAANETVAEARPAPRRDRPRKRR